MTGYGEYFITSYDSDVLGLYDCLDEYAGLDELNYLAHVLEEVRERGELEKFEAAMAFGEHTDGAGDLINLAQNLDCYDFYPGIGDDEALGRYCVEEIGAIDIPEHIRDYFDYEAYGRDIDLNSTGSFVPGGYVLRNGEPFRECYAGREDIPEEYRICGAPAQNEKEETRSILEAIRQFREAPPAPRKDREGPSHEGRYYSLDAYNWTENYVLEHSPSPEQLVMLAEERAERDRLAAALREALAYVTPTQARRLCAYYLGGLTQQQIADREHVHNSNVCLSIRRGLCNLRRYYADHPQGK